MLNFKSMKFKIFITGALLSSVLLLSGCKNTPQSTGSTPSVALAEVMMEAPQKDAKEFTMTAFQFDFDPSIITVQKGDLVRLKITSTDVDHGIAIPEFNVKANLPANEEVMIEFEADQAGEFTMFCSVMCGAGHRDMKGMLIVEEGEVMAETTPFSGSVLAGNSSQVLDFNKADYDKALKSGKPILLYFYANWCPSCKKEVKDALYPAFNEFEKEGVIGFRVNFKDSDLDKDEEALARKFGVAYQHTKVLLKNGELFLKAPDSWSSERYKQEMEKLLQ